MLSVLMLLADVKFIVRLHIEPTVILVSTKTDDSVIDCLDAEARERSSESGSSECIYSNTVPKLNISDDRFRLPFLLDIRPASEFSYDVAKSKLAGLRLWQTDEPRVTFVVPGDVVAAEGPIEDDEAVGRQDQLLRLAGWIDVESRLTVSRCSRYKALV